MTPFKKYGSQDDIIDIGEAKAKLNNFFKRILPNLTGLIVFLLLIWLATGIYIVKPDEVGVILRFGKFSRIDTPGPHYHLPYPLEMVFKPQVTKVHRIEIGFRTVSIGPPARYRSIPLESLMLTGDENIVAAEFIVQYKIKDPVAYLFNISTPELTVRSAAESALREVIGKNKIDEVLTVGKARLQADTHLLLQQILDEYKSGLQIIAVQLQDVKPPEEVIAAFKDVASAREDKEKTINQSEGYHNDLIPKAKGEAAKMINQAEAYAQSRIKRSEGEANRFLKTLEEYKKSEKIIRKRIYLETMEQIYPKVEKIIIEGKAGEKILPYLPLQRGKKIE